MTRHSDDKAFVLCVKASQLLRLDIVMMKLVCCVDIVVIKLVCCVDIVMIKLVCFVSLLSRRASGVLLQPSIPAKCAAPR